MRTTFKRLSFDDLVVAQSDSAMSQAAAKGVVTQVGGRLVQAVIQTIAFVVISRILGPNQVGIAAVAMGIVALPGNIRELGFAVPTTRRPQIDRETINSLFWLGLAVATALGVAVAVLSPIAGLVYGDSRVAKACVVLAVEIVASGLVIQHSALLRRSFRNARLVAVQILAESGGLFIGVFFALQGAGYVSIVARVLAFQIVRVAVIWAMVSWRPSRPSFSADARGAAREGGAVGLFEFANYFSRNADDLLIGWRWGTEQLGLYRRSYDLLMIPLRLVSIPVAQIALPLLGRSAGDSQRYKQNWRGLLDLLVLLTAPVSVVLFLHPEPVLQLLLGSDWITAAPILRWMAPLALLQPVVSSVGWVMLSQGRAATHLRVGVTNAVITVVAFLIALPHGPITVAAAYTLTNVVATIPVALGAATRSGPVTLAHYLDVLARAMVGALCTGVILYFVGPTKPASLVALLFTGFGAVVINGLVLGALPGGRTRLGALRSLYSGDESVGDE